MRGRDRWGSEWVRERGRLLKRERERERERKKDEESMRIGKERKIPEKQMCQNCMPTMNVNTLCCIYSGHESKWHNLPEPFKLHCRRGILWFSGY